MGGRYLLFMFFLSQVVVNSVTVYFTFYFLGTYCIQLLDFDEVNLAGR